MGETARPQIEAGPHAHATNRFPDGDLGVNGTTGLRECASTTARVETHTRGEGDEGRRRITECSGRRRHDSNSFPCVLSPVAAREQDEKGDGVWRTPDTARVGRLELGGLFGLMRIGLSGLFVPDCLLVLAREQLASRLELAR